MELEGLGASLVGRAIYVVADAEHAWIPWEFVSGTTYSCKILISGDGPGLRCVEAENTWTAVFRPTTPREWDCIATIIRGMGQTVLLTIDSCAPVPPAAFFTKLDRFIAEGINITRIWLGTIQVIPDAIFFPVLHDPGRAQAAYEMISRLPARGGHGGWAAMPVSEWNALVATAAKSNVGIVVSDVGVFSWTLFWHKVADSAAEGHGAAVKRGLAWLRTGAALIERHAE